MRPEGSTRLPNAPDSEFLLQEVLSSVPEQIIWEIVWGASLDSFFSLTVDASQNPQDAGHLLSIKILLLMHSPFDFQNLQLIDISSHAFFPEEKIDVGLIVGEVVGGAVGFKFT